MIYLIGGRGFAGSAYARLFSRLGLEHAVIGREDYPGRVGTACDVLINANGNSSKVSAARDPLADFEANVTATRRLLEDIACGCYIHLSSCDVYPDCSSPETTREDAAIDPAGLGVYGFHKFLAELCVRNRCRNWLIVRQGGMIGPGLKKNAVYDILYGPRLWLHPDSELQFIGTDDAAAIVWELYENGLRNRVVNLAGEGTVRLGEVMDWAGRYPECAADAPRVRYAVNLDFLRSRCRIPESARSVRAFVGEALAGR